MQRFASHISQNEPPRSILNSYMMSSEHKSLASNTSSHFYHDAYIFGVLWGYAEPERCTLHSLFVIGGRITFIVM